MMPEENNISLTRKIDLQSDEETREWLSLFSAIETAVILLVYSIFLAKTYCKIGFKHLGLQEHCTIWVFWVVELLNLAVFTWEYTSEQHKIA